MSLIGAGIAAGAAAFGSAADRGIGFGFGALSSRNSYKLQKKLMELQYQDYLRSLREGPTAQRAGLVAAGYNPLLAVTDGMANPFVGGVSAPSTPLSPSSAGAFDIGEQVADWSENRTAKKLVNREQEKKIENLEKQGKLLDTQIGEIHQNVLESQQRIQESKSRAFNQDADGLHKAIETGSKLINPSSAKGNAAAVGVGAAVGAGAGKTKSVMRAIGAFLGRHKGALKTFGKGALLMSLPELYKLHNTEQSKNPFKQKDTPKKLRDDYFRYQLIHGNWSR